VGDEIDTSVKEHKPEMKIGYSLSDEKEGIAS
jgi:hypothetical protein